MMKRLIFFAVFICVFSIHYEVNATNGTDVKGILRTDTVWTKEGSPYNLVDNIQVGGKLTIEPGVTIIGNRKDITIFGEMNILGNQKNKVRLINVDLKSGKYPTPGKVSIFHSQLFKCNINLSENVELKDSWVDGSFEHYPSTLPYFSYFNPTNYSFGINARIERNIFSNSSNNLNDITTSNISINNGSLVRNNVFLNKYKLKIDGDQNIIVNFNSFLSEEKNVISLNDYSKIDNIENNFWDTNIKDEISEKIYDANDNLAIQNTVNFKSYLTVPHEKNPSIIPSQSPKLTSEYTQKSTYVKGITEPNSLLHFSYFYTDPNEFGGDEGWAFVDSSGEFKIDSISSGDYTMRLTSLSNGIISNESNIKAIDNIPPQSPIVDDISDQTREVTGNAESGAIIIVKKGDEVLGTSKANLSTEEILDKNSSNYSLSIPKQVIGTKLTVYAVDLAGNTSESKEVIVLDGTPLLAPVVNDITDQTFIARGKALPGTAVEVRNGYWIIGSGITNSKGYYNFPIILQPAGTKLIVFSTKLFENVSNFTEVTVRHEIAPFEPRIISEVTDQTKEVSITANPLSKIVIMNGTKIVKATSNGYGLFELFIGRREAGEVLKFIVTDALGNVKNLETVVKDVTAPVKPDVDEITDQTTIVSGHAEASTVSIMMDSKIIGTGRVKPDSSYSIKVARQKAGSKVQVFSIDNYGNIGEFTEKIVKDVAPATPRVYEVTDQMTTVSGKTEAAAKVTVKVEGKVLSSSQADVDGNFSLTISRQVAGVKLSVVSTDSTGNTSEEKIVTVIDVTAPEAPRVDALTDQMTIVSGQTEAGTEVFVKADDKTLGTTKAEAVDGSYSLTIPRQAAGVKVSVIATDLAGNSSAATVVTVKDVTAPEAPKVDELTDQMTTVSGQAEVAAEVTVKVDDKTLGTTKAGIDGLYKLTIPRQVGGTKVSVVAKDLAGNSSAATVVTVKDVTAPEAPKVDELTDQMTTVSGQAEVATEVIVKVGDKTLGTTKVGTDGLYKLTIPRQVAGTKVSVVAKDLAGNSSVETIVTVKDVTAPEVPKVDVLTDQMTTVSGQAEIAAEVTVKVGDKKLGTTKVGTDGLYKLTIPRQVAGTKVSIFAKDLAGNSSVEVVITVKDVTPPAMPKVGEVTDQSLKVDGFAEPLSKIILKSNGKTIKEGIVAKDGKYSISITKQKAGNELMLIAIDKYGNQSAPKKVIVVDKTPPVLLAISPVSDQSRSIKGRTEIGAKIYIKSGKKVIGSTTLTKEEFSIKITKQKAGTKLTILAVDSSGNRSKEKQVIVSDRTPPAKPIVAKVTFKDKFLNGKAEKNAKILIYSNSKKIEEGNVDSKGQFKIAIKAQKRGSLLKIYAQDKYLNRSKEIIIKVS